ncbi:sodium-dependent glucose transporter 1 isoform X1 [Pseudonaja textilis]|uniref:Major facilitator superfamily domain containing 4B n=2 Tax=Pseudonaja textilis TaxID=8673 RepID=A0A670ZFA9_PSETE|nr:sodium-dependent glucose transporter 1 isoform X1 [Pseudonaja textilis]
MAGAAKKQVRFARLEEEGAREEAGAVGDAAGEDAASGESPPGCSAPLALQPVVKVAGGSGRRSRAGGGGHGEGKQATAAASRRALKWCISAALCAAFLGLGMAIAILGPTFQDLAANVNKNVSQISYIFVGRSAGYFGGSLIGGILFDCMNSKLLLGLSMLGTTVGLYAIPWCKKAILLTTVMSVIGFAMGILDTGGNVLALDTWQAEAGPHIQALHFSFALGAFVAPILAKMALGGSSLELQIHLGGSIDNQSTMNPPGATSLPKLHLNGNFLWSYAVVGTYLLLVALFFFTLYWRSIPVRGRTKLSMQKYQIAKYHHALIILLSVFFFWYVGAEVTYGSYIFTYAKTYAVMKEMEAAGLNSLFWGTFAACRGLAICFATCSYPGSMILISIVGSTVSSLFLVLFSVHTVTLWVGSAVYGASMATIFPSGISWIEQYTTVQGKSAAMFVMGAALGEMCIPAAVGFLQGYFPTLPVLMYTALVAAVMTAVLFPVMCKLAASTDDAKLKGAGDREVQEALLSNTYLEDDEEDNEIREWNAVDFEIIEMNDTLQNSVIETSKKIQGEFATTISSQTPSENLSFNSSPILAVKSPKQKSSDKND